MPLREFNATARNFRGNLASGKWTLCIGAGVSRGIVPTWDELTRRLVNDTFSTSFSEDEFRKECSEIGWSLDSWIQACANHFLLTKRTLSDFYELIETHIYSDLRAKSRAYRIEETLLGVLDKPHTCSRKEVSDVCTFFEKEYTKTSLINVTKSLLLALKKKRLPDAIVTFNADTLLHTLIDLYQRRDHYLGPPPHGHPNFAFKTIFRPLESTAREVVPIYHCHGAIKPRGSKAKRAPRDSRDRLVFLESEYIRVATTSASWAETLFMFQAQTTRMLCLGFSMSDPNMRRWFALSNLSAIQDISTFAKITNITPRHIWITTSPASPEIRAIRNESMIHLGVRPGWIDRWADVPAVFENLLSL